MTATAQFGLTGLAVMGANLSRNIARHGFSVAVHNRTQERADAFLERYGDEGTFVGTRSIRELVAAVERPRRIMIMVKAGDPVDRVIAELRPHLEPGDVVIDGGNSFFQDTRRREADLRRDGLLFLGAGVSGGEEGALHGPSIMPGGPPEAWAAVQDVLTAIAARAPDGSPCVTHVGADGAGHYVKMVHNGIEYADIQLIAEAYDLLRTALGMEPPQLAEVFRQWNDGDLESFLIEITATVLAKTDAATGRPLVDVISDEAEQKGTGRWSSQSALELGVPATGITEAVFARVLSSQKDQRARASGLLPGPEGAPPAPDGFVEDVRDALYASKVIAYAQGFELIAAAAEQYGWDVDLGATAGIWRAGCIIRARFLDRITDAYAASPELRNLLVADYFREAVGHAQGAWRRVVAHGVQLGVPTPAFSSSLAYYDGYRRERLPANLIQGLRDLFGAHTYRRIDREGTFHTLWGEDGREVPA